MRIVHIVGARPNFMKLAPVVRALSQYPQFKQDIIHTGQHYDNNMSDIFFSQLDIPEPTMNLEVGSASHTQQTAQIMLKLEAILAQQAPDYVMVYGDVNSTIAAALVCAKMRIPFAHVEAGLRSHDRHMPEEINRILTDQIADLLFTPSCDGNENLQREGISTEKIHLVGNVMIDTLIHMLNAAHTSVNLPAQYGLVTLHRPSNVDDRAILHTLINTLGTISATIPLIFPMHPRTRQRVDVPAITRQYPNLNIIAPIGYLEFLAMQKTATFMITDSGGVQEETTYLQIPCITVRENTERPITISNGTNVLVGQDMALLRQQVNHILNGNWQSKGVPALWDGKAGQRIAAILRNL